MAYLTGEIDLNGLDTDILGTRRHGQRQKGKNLYRKPEYFARFPGSYSFPETLRHRGRKKEERNKEKTGGSGGGRTGRRYLIEYSDERYPVERSTALSLFFFL